MSFFGTFGSESYYGTCPNVGVSPKGTPASLGAAPGGLSKRCLAADCSCKDASFGGVTPLGPPVGEDAEEPLSKGAPSARGRAHLVARAAPSPAPTRLASAPARRPLHARAREPEPGRGPGAAASAGADTPRRRGGDSALTLPPPRPAPPPGSVAARLDAFLSTSAGRGAALTSQTGPTCAAALSRAFPLSVHNA